MSAESAVVSAINLTRASHSDPRLQVTLHGVQPGKLGTTYELTGADNTPGGMSLLDLLGPGVYVAHACSSNDRALHVEARRSVGRWIVLLSAAEGS